MKGGLVIANTVTGCYIFCGFPAFRHIFTPPKTTLFPNRSRLDCWGRGRGVLVQVLICEGKKFKIQSNHIIIHQKKLFFSIKSWSRLKVQIYLR